VRFVAGFGPGDQDAWREKGSWDLAWTPELYACVRVTATLGTTWTDARPEVLTAWSGWRREGPHRAPGGPTATGGTYQSDLRGILEGWTAPPADGYSGRPSAFRPAADHDA
jgi:hypothetical protein